MSTVETWTHPAYERTAAWHMQETSIFNDKLLAVGLIDYTGNNTAQITAMGLIDFALPRTIRDFEMATLYYKLPVGDNSIEVENVIGESYKNIVRESYSSTECYIKISVVMARASVATDSINLANPNLYRFNFSISFSKLAIFSGQESKISLYGYAGSYVPSTSVNYATSTANSIVYLSGDTLHISFLHVRAISNGGGYYETTFNHPHHLIHFTLYRNDGEITIFHPTYRSDMGSINISSSESYFLKPSLLVIDRYGVETLSVDQTTFIQNGVTNYIPLDSTGKKYFRYTYCGLYTGIKVNPSVLKGVAASTTVVNKVMNYSDVIMNYRGHKVKMKYFDYGEFWMPFRWSVLNNSDVVYQYTTFSYYILINNHPCTTNSVGNP